MGYDVGEDRICGRARYEGELSSGWAGDVAYWHLADTW